MSSTSVPDAPVSPVSTGVPSPASRRGLGSLRSMVISMIVILAAVMAWVAMVPRVRQISQPAVDVTALAVQVRRDTGWAISQPRLPAGWKATNARFESAAGGVRTSGTWHAGYLTPDGHYISIDQTAPTTVPAAIDSWVSARTSNGQAEGSLTAAGKTWDKLSSRSTVQRSLVSKGSLLRGSAANASEPRGLTTVLSGTGPYSQLAQFAQALRPVPAS